MKKFVGRYIKVISTIERKYIGILKSVEGNVLHLKTGEGYRYIPMQQVAEYTIIGEKEDQGPLSQVMVMACSNSKMGCKGVLGTKFSKDKGVSQNDFISLMAPCPSVCSECSRKILGKLSDMEDEKVVEALFNGTIFGDYKEKEDK